MNKILTPAVIVLLIFSQNLSGQVKDSLLNSLYTRYNSFDYENVITISNDLLENKSLFNINEIIEIYRIRATAQFTIINEDSAKNSLRQIILLNESYSLDPITNSPKLVDLYEDLKRIHLLEKQNQAVQDSIRLSEPVKEQEVYYSKNDMIQANNMYRNSITRSLFVPGWGHLYLGKNNFKGIVLTASSLGALGGMIYYILDSNKKEKAYLQEPNKALINSKYESFNKSYKIRNALITAFSAIWLYTQIDLLYISSDNFGISGSLSPLTDQNSDLRLLITLNF